MWLEFYKNISFYHIQRHLTQKTRNVFEICLFDYITNIKMISGKIIDLCAEWGSSIFRFKDLIMPQSQTTL